MFPNREQGWIFIGLNATLKRGESMSAQSQSATAIAVRKLAEKHHVAYVRTHSDALAHHITRLAGDRVELDEVERLLIALQRAGHLSRVEAVRLQASYLREARS
jgi:hypothetical protein